MGNHQPAQKKRQQAEVVLPSACPAPPRVYYGAAPPVDAGVAAQVAAWTSSPAYRADPHGFVAALRRFRGDTQEHRIPFDGALRELERALTARQPGGDE